MQFDPVLIEPRREAMTAAGYWRGRTINDVMAAALTSCPERTAVIAHRSDHGTRTAFTYRELDALADQFARALRDRGIGRFDVVSFQLPNWWELVVVALGCAKVGAVANPLMSIFRQRELTFMLNLAESKMLLVPNEYRGFNYEAMATSMGDALQHDPELVVVGSAGPNGFSTLLASASAAPLPPSPLEANDVLLVMYTSGTTGEPKGVMHTSNTLFANALAFVDHLELSASDVVLGSSPMAHLTGYGYLAMTPLILNATTVLQDVWDARRALEIVNDERVTFSMASSPFVADMCDAAEAGAPVTPGFDKYCCAGAPIPPVLIKRAHRVLGLTVCSAWGMTENGAVTITPPARAAEKSGVSDGQAVAGMEVMVVDGSHQPVPSGTTGALLVRGASMFGGYLKRPELNNTDADGWFETGDLAFLDDEGYVRIDGRSKDLIIRGGENIPVIEIENLLYEHPNVTAVAIVGYPDERLGERACAFVSLTPGAALSVADVREFLGNRDVARQYHPERVEVIDEMPRTPSGKIQKFRLRDYL